VVLEPWQWVLGAVAAFLIGVAKTGISGLGIFAIVIFASVLPARESVGIVLAILIAADLVAVIIYRREAHWGHLLRLFPWAAAGVVVGALTTGRIDNELMRLLIGAIVVALSVLQFVRSRRGTPNEERVWPPWLSAATGLLAGFTTMVANAAGPLMVIYLLAMRLPKLVFIGTTAWFFLVLNLFKVPFSFGLGLISLQSLGLSAQLILFAIVGALVGRPLVARIDQQLFEHIALALSFVAGVRLLLI
jgi:hypothetical protein